MKFVFRADASLQIGSGHIMRCLTLADALQIKGAVCRFICRFHPGNLMDQIRMRGHEVFMLPSRDDAGKIKNEGHPVFDSWLDVDWLTDAQQTKALLPETVDWMVVDHYGLDQRWHQVIHPNCMKIMVIDDLANRSHDCDLLLDQNLGRYPHDYQGIVPEACKILAGPRYALLRPEFAKLRAYSLKRRVKGRLERLLITMGGVDQQNATGFVLEALTACDFKKDLHITVVMGAHAPWLEQVKAQAQAMPWQTEVVVNVTHMAKLMADSDLAIGAAGSTAWERCCLGLPSLLVVLAENQWAGARALHDNGCAQLLGVPADIPQRLEFALFSTLRGKTLVEMSQAAQSVTRGQGTRLTIREMGIFE